jgi:hypothetical protein
MELPYTLRTEGTLGQTSSAHYSPQVFWDGFKKIFASHGLHRSAQESCSGVDLPLLQQLNSKEKELLASGFNNCSVRQCHGIEHFIGPKLFKRDQPETERIILESKAYDLKGSVSVEFHCPVQRQFNDLQTRDRRLNIFPLRFEPKPVPALLVAKQYVAFRRGDGQ